ncbi:hypothetical protein A0J61_05211 [Choanephora cucurbitarum]|uniref:Uncharacterized protein n=1 Tax=Choanephora cucurbitarum TaxID=101091 RepID=A0A1C7NDA4_9FUNG|nr:hypothetical protein A0J61_05211 [Choanephora cucurbitarum]
MSLLHSPTFRKYFNNCDEKSTVPSFSGFITHHHKFIINHSDQRADEFQFWYCLFKENAKYFQIEVEKGDALKKWKELVCGQKSKNTKRSRYQKEIVEEFEAVAPAAPAAPDVPDVPVPALTAPAVPGATAATTTTAATVDFLAGFSRLRSRVAQELPKPDILKSIHVDLDKLLAIQGILRVSKSPHKEIKEVLGAKTCSKIKQELFGKSNRMPTSIKQDLEDALLDFADAEDDEEAAEELEDRLFSLKKKASGAAERVVKLFIKLYDNMKQEKQAADEMFLQSNIVPALCQLFKASRHHHPEGCNKVIFPGAAAVSECRPDFVVAVEGTSPFINVIGEIKGDGACNEGIALDAYRLGLFGLLMLREHKLKSSMVFQVTGLNATFYLCSRLGGIVAMVEIGTLSLPSTFEDFSLFGSQTQIMFDISMLYEQHCDVDHSLAAPEWKLVSYNAIKELYGISETSTVKASKTSSTDVLP